MTSSAVIYADKCNYYKKMYLPQLYWGKLHIKLLLFTLMVIEKLYYCDVHALSEMSNNSCKSFLIN